MSFSDWGLGLAGQPGVTGAPGTGGGIADAPNDGFFYGRQSLAWVNGNVKFGGTIDIAPNTGSAVVLFDKRAGANINQIQGRVSGTIRWGMQLGNAIGETGSNAGSNFEIDRYSDTGVYLDTPFAIIRSSGITGIGSGTIAQTYVLSLTSSASGHARIFMNISGVRAWTCGAINNAHFYIADESGAVTVADFVPGGGVNFTGNGTISGTLTVNSGWITIGYTGIHYDYPGFGSGNAIAFQWNGTYIIGIIDYSVAYQLGPVSDARLKSDIAPSRFDCLAAVERLPLYEYRWKDHPEPGTVIANPDAPLVPVGFVAQRLHEQLPWLAAKGDDHAEIRDQTALADRHRSDPGNLMWNIDQNNTLALITGAVQQLSTQVKTLQTALAQVHGELQQAQAELIEVRNGNGRAGGASAPPADG
jgi:hypothetical protein